MINIEDRIERLGLTCTFDGKQFVRGHECVDLGLPSGTLWAKCNLGAKKETDCGNYYQFGHFEPYEKTFKDRTLMEFDTVDVVWRNGWKTPTKEQFQELCENTTSVWTKINGIEGRRFISKIDKRKYVFFPAVGYCGNGSVCYVGSLGYYWSSSVLSSSVQYAYRLLFSSSDVNWQSRSSRYSGFPVRGVLAENS